MEAMKRKAESGKIWKNSENLCENDGKRQRQKKAEDLSAEYARINIRNDETYNIMMKKATEAETMV